MCVHITNYHLTPDVHIPSQRVKEYSECPVNDTEISSDAS